MRSQLVGRSGIPSVDLRGALTTPNGQASGYDYRTVGPLAHCCVLLMGSADGRVPGRTRARAAAFLSSPGELRHAEWKELDFDKAEWIILRKK